VKWVSGISHKRKSEFLGFLLLVLSLFVLLSLQSHVPGDDQWLRADGDEIWLETYYPRNLAGRAGAVVSYTLYESLGWSSWLLALALGGYGLRRFLLKGWRKPVWVPAGLFAGTFVTGVILALPAARDAVPWTAGAKTLSGQFGRASADIVVDLVGVMGGTLLLGACIAVGVYWSIPWTRLGIRWPHLKFSRRKKSKAAPSRRSPFRATVSKLNDWWRSLSTRVTAAFDGPEEAVEGDTTDDWERIAAEPNGPQVKMVLRTGPQPDDENDSDDEDLPEPKPASRPRRVVRQPSAADGDYVFPSLDLLAPPVPPSRRRADSHAGRDLLRDALKTFDIGIDGEIQCFPGPVITRYEFRPAPGVKVNQVVNLSDDLALALSASRVRVVAPIPGKAAVGIEIPNHDPEMVSLSALLNDPAFVDRTQRLPLALGRTIDGSPFVADLAGMPHLLIAGATGSGKSVCINVIITSILYRHHPRDVRLLFIDPKMLELSMYKGIPHLERPVVTNPRAAERLLNDAVREMDDRYKVLAEAGVRNIADFNTRMEADKRLPYIVIVVDELADLMLSQSATRIEMMITRLAQMARAVGIHLILATQRPSVDVITGLIKANFSCRIAFQVATKVDSRTILDGNGAEKLLGRGDMLYLSPGRPEPERVHGAFVSSEESTALVDFLREQVVEPDAIQNFSESTESSVDTDDDFGDVLFHQAADVVIRHKQGSVSLLQRRLGIGYQRAARLIDKLEEAGVVGPYDGSKAREVLWSREQFDEKFANTAQ
jgi:DNA segregation ATPase FtsK/SpoIIIE, S-DNA-T family